MYTPAKDYYRLNRPLYTELRKAGDVETEEFGRFV